MVAAVSLDALGSYSWVVIPVGLFLGLLGYRLYRLSLFVIGLFLGLAIGSWIGESAENSQLGLVLGLVLGTALGVTAHFLVRFSLFVAGVTSGVIAALLVLPTTAVVEGSLEYFAWTGGAALTGGILTMFFYKILIYFATSVIGTYLIYAGTIELFPEEAQSWLWILYAVLLLVFILVQAGSRRGREGHAIVLRTGRRGR